MTPKRRIGLAASVVAIAGALATPVFAQTKDATAPARSPSAEEAETAAPLTRAQRRAAEEVAIRQEIDQRERRGMSNFFASSTTGAPSVCRSRQGDRIGQPAITVEEALDNVNLCYEALTERSEPYLNRRGAYSSVSTFGAIGAAAGGAQMAATTASWWGGLVLLPILVEGTLDRPEFDALDRVTARGLHWINGRAVQMEGLERQIAERHELMDKTVDDLEEQRRLLRSIRDGLTAAEGEPDVEVTRASIDTMDDGLATLLEDARDTERALRRTSRSIHGGLPTWVNGRLQHVMENYDSKRRTMALRPQRAARSILALPISTLANIVRGSDGIPEADYFGALAAADLRELGSPIDLPTIPDTNAADVSGDPAHFPTAHRRDIRELLRIAADATEQIEDSIALLEHTSAANAAGPPDFSRDGATREQSEAASQAQQDAPSPPSEAPTDAPAAPATPDAPKTPADTGGEGGSNGGG